MSRPILNIADVEFRKYGHGVDFPGATNAPETFEARLGDIGRRLGAQKLGYNLTVVPPGKRAFPPRPCAWPWASCRKTAR